MMYLLNSSSDLIVLFGMPIYCLYKRESGDDAYDDDTKRMC